MEARSPASKAPPSSQRLVALLVPLLLMLTGCLSGDVDVTLEADGSGQIVVEVFPGRQLDALLAGADLDRLIDVTTSGADDTEVESFVRDGKTGYRLTVAFDGYGEVLLALQGRASVAGRSVRLLSSGDFRQLPDDEGWELTATVAPLDEVLAQAGTDSSVVDLSQLLGAAADPSAGTGLDLSITLPGRVVSSNADVVRGGTATWSLDEPDAPQTLRMRTQPDPLVTPVRLVVGGALLAIVVGFVFAAWGATRQYRVSRSAKRRRRRDARFPGTSPVNSSWAPPAAGVRSAPSGEQAPPTLPTLGPSPVATIAQVDEGAPEHRSGADVGPAPTESGSGLPEGWYADPERPDGLRWWDGTAWTGHRA